MNVIILKSSAYKEKDGIIHCLSKDKTIDILVKSLYSKKGKYNSLNISLLRANIELNESKNYRYPLLLDVGEIDSPLPIKYDLKTTSSLLFISEIANKILPSDEQYLLFDLLNKCLDYLKRNIDPYLVDLYFLIEAIKYQGYDFDYDKCHICGSRKNIIDFNLYEGGFTCLNCLKLDQSACFSKNELSLLYDITHVDSLEKINEKYEIHSLLKIMEQYLIFIKDSLGVYINAFDLLK